MQRFYCNWMFVCVCVCVCVRACVRACVCGQGVLLRAARPCHPSSTAQGESSGTRGLQRQGGKDYKLWHKVLGRHGLSKENSNGTMLLDLCVKHSLVVTNTVFQQANKYKASWMRPRSKHWHLIDYVLTRQHNIRDIRLTCVMRPTSIWSDH